MTTVLPHEIDVESPNDAIRIWLRTGARTARSFETTSRRLIDAMMPASVEHNGSDAGSGHSSERSADERSTDELQIGDTVTYTKRLTETDVREFARASGDTNPLHLVESYARESRFGNRIAHGMLVAGVISAALAELPGVVVYLSQDLRFLAPVEIGDRVTAECEVLEPLGDDRYRLRTLVRTDDGETVLDGEAVVLIDEPPASAQSTGANTYVNRYQNIAVSTALQSLESAAESPMSRPSKHRSDDPVSNAIDQQRRVFDLTRRAAELQADLPRRAGRAVLEETPQARSTQQRAESVVRDMTRLALRAPVTAWASSERAAEAEVDIDELVERSFDPFEDLWTANWSLVETGLDNQLAAYETLVTATTDAASQSPGWVLGPWSDADERGRPDR